MTNGDEANLSEQTKAEMELGRKTLAENQAKIEQAMKERAGEAVVPPELSEADKAVAEAKPLKRKGFPVADDKVKT